MSGLGRGLGSLIPKKPMLPLSAMGVGAGSSSSTGSASNEMMSKTFEVPESSKTGMLEVDINAIDPNPFQPRTVFNPEDLQELVDSIKIHGVMQPLVVTKQGNRYELIAGERRLRASKLAGLTKIPVVIREWVDDRTKLELALIENLQRSDLNPIEEALAYQLLMEEFALTQEEVSKRVGKSRPAVANAVRLLQLPTEIQTALREKRIAAGQARAILALKSESEQLALFHKIMNEGMTSRQAEDATIETRISTSRRDPNLMAYENELRQALGTKVKITEKNGRGKIVIDYFSRTDLMEMKKKMTGL
ncbi:MAG: ParB/RepB/Spo0J family partition protein [bacterium]